MKILKIISLLSSLMKNGVNLIDFLKLNINLTWTIIDSQKHCSEIELDIKCQFAFINKCVQKFYFNSSHNHQSHIYLIVHHCNISGIQITQEFSVSNGNNVNNWTWSLKIYHVSNKSFLLYLNKIDKYWVNFRAVFA